MIHIEIDFVDESSKQISIGYNAIFTIHEVLTRAECIELAKVFKQAADELCEWPEDK